MQDGSGHRSFSIEATRVWNNLKPTLQFSLQFPAQIDFTCHDTLSANSAFSLIHIMGKSRAFEQLYYCCVCVCVCVTSQWCVSTEWVRAYESTRARAHTHTHTRTSATAKLPAMNIAISLSQDVILTTDTSHCCPGRGKTLGSCAERGLHVRVSANLGLRQRQTRSRVSTRDKTAS